LKVKRAPYWYDGRENSQEEENTVKGSITTVRFSLKYIVKQKSKAQVLFISNLRFKDLRFKETNPQSLYLIPIDYQGNEIYKKNVL